MKCTIKHNAECPPCNQFLIMIEYVGFVFMLDQNGINHNLSFLEWIDMAEF